MNAVLLFLASATMTQMPDPAVPPARIDHVAIQASDPARSVAFYQSLFGLRELPAPVTFVRWLDLGGGTALHIIGGRKGPPDDNRSQHIALSVGDFAVFLARVKAAGLVYTNLRGEVGGIDTVRAEGVQQVFLRDPDGHYVELNNMAELAAKGDHR